MLWYVPFGLVALCSFGLILAMVVVFVWMRCRELIRVRIDGIIKETCLLLGFLVVFCILFLIEVVIRLVLYSNESIYILWLVYAISTPISGVVIPIGFFSYLQCKLHCISRKQREELDGTLEDRTAPESSRVSAPSVTTAQNFLTNSNEEDNEASINKPEKETTPLSETRPLLEQGFGSACKCM